MNAYLIYLATVLSSSIFNTINYINHKKLVNSIKNRKLIYKKDLCYNAKTKIMVGELTPVSTFLVATIKSLIPLFNIFVPSLYNSPGYVDMMEKDVEGDIKEANFEEFKNRLINGVDIYNLILNDIKIPEEYYNSFDKVGSLDLAEEFVDFMTKNIKTDLSVKDDFSANDIRLVSDKGYKKICKKVLKLNKDVD